MRKKGILYWRVAWRLKPLPLSHLRASRKSSKLQAVCAFVPLWLMRSNSGWRRWLSESLNPVLLPLFAVYTLWKGRRRRVALSSWNERAFSGGWGYGLVTFYWWLVGITGIKRTCSFGYWSARWVDLTELNETKNADIIVYEGMCKI